MTLGKGAAISSSNKMKCNTKSFTKTELIALHDKLPDVIWTRYFVECQGCDIDECTIFQDNMSTLLLGKNIDEYHLQSNQSISKLNISSLKITMMGGEVDLRYCSTDAMWADVLTKPLQGQKFRDMRAFLQNCSRDYDDDFEQDKDKQGRAHQSMNHQVMTNASLRECVEDQQKTQNLPASQPRAHSPTSVAKLAP
jgi:hypothetical protein